MVFDSANTSLLYTLSYIWRNPILFFFFSKYLKITQILRNSPLTVIYIVSVICCICKS
ncbi:hypothetical protein HanHA300_Chr00c0174g0724501 [Helianthus annuus]|nr:hypothetical protein HanHA300_Chr00c0174g0724501 [Helianthus annuus]